MTVSLLIGSSVSQSYVLSTYGKLTFSIQVAIGEIWASKLDGGEKCQNQQLTISLFPM
jgi:hypothetical protein